MKKLFTLVIFAGTTPFSQAQFGFNTYYQYSNAMMQELHSAHGFGMDIWGGVKHSPYSIGLSYSMGIYGYKHSPLDVVMADSSTMSTYMDNTNAYHNIAFYQRWQFPTFSGFITPFADARMGASIFRTGLYIEDPEEPSSCKALEQSTLHHDATWLAYAGVGADLKLSGLFNEKNRTAGDKGCFFQFGAGLQFGGKVSYLNVDADEEPAIQSGHNHGGTGTSTGNSTKDPHYTTFINTQTQFVHQHQTGYTYTSPVRMVQLRAGIAWKF